MTRIRTGDLFLWIAAAIVTGIGVTVGWPRSQERASTTAVRQPPGVLHELIDSQFGRSISVNAIVDPFAGVPPAAEPIEAPEQIEDPPAYDPVDQLTFSGVAGGPPWLALIAHAESRRSQVAGVGDTLGGVRILSVERDSIVLESAAGVRVLHIGATGR